MCCLSVVPSILLTWKMLRVSPVIEVYNVHQLASSARKGKQLLTSVCQNSLFIVTTSRHTERQNSGWSLSYKGSSLQVRKATGNNRTTIILWRYIWSNYELYILLCNRCLSFCSSFFSVCPHISHTCNSWHCSHLSSSLDSNAAFRIFFSFALNLETTGLWSESMSTPG